jgi:hypothetical protein
MAVAAGNADGFAQSAQSKTRLWTPVPARQRGQRAAGELLAAFLPYPLAVYSLDSGAQIANRERPDQSN